MAEQRTTVTNDKLEEVRNILEGFKEDARNAEQGQDLFMLWMYTRLIQVVSEVLLTASARVEREANAAINKSVKQLRKAQHEQRKAEREGRATAAPSA